MYFKPFIQVFIKLHFLKSFDSDTPADLADCEYLPDRFNTYYCGVFVSIPLHSTVYSWGQTLKKCVNCEQRTSCQFQEHGANSARSEKPIPRIENISLYLSLFIICLAAERVFQSVNSLEDVSFILNSLMPVQKQHTKAKKQQKPKKGLSVSLIVCT